MKKRILVILSCLVCMCSARAQDLVTKIDSKSGKVGIWNERTKKWTTPPSFYNILHSGEYTGDQYHITYFIAVRPKYTLIPATGIATGAPVFDDIKEVENNKRLALIKTKGAWWFYVIGKGILASAGSFSEYKLVSYNSPLLKIKKGNNWQLFDSKNNKLLPLSYPEIREIINSAQDSVPLVIARKEKWGLANLTGKILIPFNYDTVFFESVFKVTKAGKQGIFDQAGKAIVPCTYDSVTNSVVVVMNAGVLEEVEAYRLAKGNEYTYVDMNGNPLQNIRYTDIRTRFSERNDPVLTRTLFLARKNSKWGIVDSSDAVVIPFIYDEINAGQNANLYVRKEGKSGIINLENKIVFPFTFDHFFRIDENFRIKTKSKLLLVNKGCGNCGNEDPPGLWGLADSTGKIMLEPQANTIKLYTNYYYVNPEFEGAEDSMLVGYLWNTGGKKIRTNVLMDSIDQVDYSPEGQEIYYKRVSYEYCDHLEGGKTGIINPDGNFILPPVFDNLILAVNKWGGERVFYNVPINQQNNSLKEDYNITTEQDIIAVKDKKYGVYNWTGKEIIPCLYDSIAFELTHNCLSIMDSLFGQRGYPKKLYKVYSNGKYGYFGPGGKELSPLAIAVELAQIDIASYDSVLQNSAYSAFPENLSCVNIAVNNPSIKKYTLHQKVEEYNENGEEMQVNREADFNFIEKGTFNFLDNSSLEFAPGSWVEDLVLIDNNFRSYRLGNAADQARISFSGIIDSVCDGKTKIAGDLNYTMAQHFLDYVFVKTGSKWYLKNFYNESLINKSCGFDSVSMYTAAFFKGWLNGKYGYYSFKEKNFTAPRIMLEFPERGAYSRIVCSDCDYIMNKYYTVEEVQDIDENGNEVFTTKNVLHEIPFVKKGKFNILDENNALVLEKWADEIRIAVPDPRNDFSITDSSSSVYKKWSWKSGDDWPLFDKYKQSLALKYDNLWRITSLTNPGICLDGFDDAGYANPYWAVKKNGKTALVDTNGTFVFHPVYGNFSVCSPIESEIQPENLFVYLQNAKVNPSFRSGPVSDLLIIIDGNKYGVHSVEGKEIIPSLYDSISYEFNRSHDYEKDSLFTAAGGQKYYFKVYKGKQFGYFSIDGRQLCPISLDKELGDILVPTPDSLVDKTYAKSFIGSQSSVELVAAQAEIRPVKIYTSVPDINMEGNEIISASSEICNLVSKGSFNLLYNPSRQLMSDTWFDDIVLIGNFASYPVSAMNTQLLINSFPGDSIVDTILAKTTIINASANDYAAKNLKNQVFVKRQGKYFLFNLFQADRYPNSLGFDSISIENGEVFKGFSNKKFAYYQFTDSLQQTPVYDMAYPQGNESERIVCRNCSFELKKCKEGIMTEETDAYGNANPVVSYQLSAIPLVKKGEFNILDTNYKLLLGKWADDILLPGTDNNCLLGVTDSAGAVYHQQEHKLGNVWKGTATKSMALKYGDSWRLTTAAQQDVFIDGFEKIAFKNGYWEAAKNGKIYFYRAEDLQEK